MQLIIDVDQQEVVQSFGSLQAVSQVECKSQDTPKLDIYFSRGGINLDLGSAPGLRFGVFEPANPNPLVEQATFTRVVDANGLICYTGYPNFNTTQVATALGAAQTLGAVGEVRYQSNGAIERTLDIPYSIIRSLLAETILDSTQAAFTVPAVAANVTIQITSTSWLQNGQNLFIGGGAGNYQVVSITDATHFVGENQGGSNNAAQGTVIPLNTSVGNASTSALPTYPDPSIVEVTTHKDQASGYAGLNASKLLAGTEIPVDGTTINLNGNGQLEALVVGAAGENAFTTTTAAFTTPAVGGVVQVAVGSTDWMGGIGYVVFVTGGGYYSVNAIIDKTDVKLTNLGYSDNVSPGTTVSANSKISPAAPSGATGASGADGAPGANAYDTLAADFTMPAVGGTVTVTISNTNWLALGQEIFIGSGAGYFNVQSIANLTSFTAENSPGYAGNASPGTTIPSGTRVTPAGVAGPQGPAGTGTGDMLRSVYDTNNNNVVDTCDALAWGKLTSVPATFPPSLTDAETTTGATLLGTSTGQIKRIVAGANLTLDTTTTPGGVIINGTTGGSLTPDAGIEVWDSFDGAANPKWSTSTGTGGTITFPSTFGHDATNKNLGGIDLSTAAAVNSYAQLWYGTTAPKGFPGALGVLTFEARVALQSIPSASTDQPRIVFGIGNYANPGVIDQSIGFQYLLSNAANWQIFMSGSGVSSYPTTTITPDTSFHKYKFVTTSDWTGPTTFYIDNVSVGTANLGAGNFWTEPLQAFFLVTKNAGSTAAFKITVGWVHWKYAVST